MERELRICPECQQIVMIGYGYQVIHSKNGFEIRKSTQCAQGLHYTCALNVMKRRNRKAPEQRVFKWA